MNNLSEILLLALETSIKENGHGAVLSFKIRQMLITHFPNTRKQVTNLWTVSSNPLRSERVDTRQPIDIGKLAASLKTKQAPTEQKLPELEVVAPTAELTGLSGMSLTEISVMAPSELAKYGDEMKTLSKDLGYALNVNMKEDKFAKALLAKIKQSLTDIEAQQLDAAAPSDMIETDTEL